VIGNHHLMLDPAHPVDVVVLKGVNMSYRRTALQGFRFDERMASYSSSWNEMDLAFHVRRTGGRLVYDPAIQVNHHASPRPDWKRDDPIRFYDGSHNYTYVMLKHLAWGRRVAFLLYVFLVGQRATWGLLSAAHELLVRRRRVPWDELRHSIGGKCAGVRTFLAWRRRADTGERCRDGAS
jgi:hypothetical protein